VRQYVDRSQLLVYATTNHESLADAGDNSLLRRRPGASSVIPYVPKTGYENLTAVIIPAKISV